MRHRPKRCTRAGAATEEAVSIDVTVRITRDGDVEVTVGDEGGYSPDVIDDLARRAREQAIALHLQLHHPTKAKP